MTDIPSNKHHRFWMVKYVVWLLVVALVLLFFVFPFLLNYALHNGYDFKSMSRWLDVMQWLQTFAMHAFVYLWITFLGSCFASFLNVVAWRVPRGRSILGSSHCPHCESQLSFKDNIPIFGWLNNGGQCRRCAAPIAVRYLIVELLLGAVFLWLFLIEVIWGGMNLPIRPDLHKTGVEFVLFTPNWFLILTFVYHATLMCGLFTIAMIASEHKRIPVLVIFFAAIFLVAVASTWPYVIQVPCSAGVSAVTDWPPKSFSRMSLYTMVIGGGAGVIAGAIVWGIGHAGRSRSLAHTHKESNDSADAKFVGAAVVTSMGLVGLSLGWQSAIWVLLIWCCCTLILKRFLPTGILAVVSNGSAVAMFATIVHLTFWCWQMPSKIWLNE